MTKLLRLGNGGVTLVDDEDYEDVSQYNWSRHALGYVFRGFGPKKQRKYQYLHRRILGEPPTNGHRIVVDHINRNRLDNRRANLRVTTKSVNVHNRGKFVGVSWSRSHQRWHARIKYDGVVHNLGYFRNFTDAVVVRKRADWAFRAAQEV